MLHLKDNRISPPPPCQPRSRPGESTPSGAIRFHLFKSLGPMLRALSLSFARCIVNYPAHTEPGILGPTAKVILSNNVVVVDLSPPSDLIEFCYLNARRTTHHVTFECYFYMAESGPSISTVGDGYLPSQAGLMQVQHIVISATAKMTVLDHWNAPRNERISTTASC